MVYRLVSGCQRDDKIGREAYRRTGKVDDHEEEVNAAAKGCIAEGPYLRYDDGAERAAGCGKVETPCAHRGWEDL